MSFNEKKKDFLTFYGLWFNEVRPQLAGLKISLIKNSNNFLYVFLGIIFFQIGLFISSFIVRKQDLISNRDTSEKETLNTIKMALVLPLKNKKIFKEHSF